MPAYLGQFQDVSKRYTVKVKALKGDKRYNTKISIEVHNIKNPKDIRSYRTESKVDIESFIGAVIASYGYFLADKGWFNDIDGTMIPDKAFRVKIEDIFTHLKKRYRIDLGNGIKKYYEEVRLGEKKK